MANGSYIICEIHHETPGLPGLKILVYLEDVSCYPVQAVEFVWSPP